MAADEFRQLFAGLFRIVICQRPVSVRQVLAGTEGACAMGGNWHENSGSISPDFGQRKRC